MTRISDDEAGIKRACEELLGYKMNLGQLWFTRLNSGSVFIKQGANVYKAKLSPIGTPDLMVIQKGRIVFFEIKSSTGKLTFPQEITQSKLKEQGAQVYTIRSVEEMEEILREKNKLEEKTADS